MMKNILSFLIILLISSACASNSMVTQSLTPSVEPSSNMPVPDASFTQTSHPIPTSTIKIASTAILAPTSAPTHTATLIATATQTNTPIPEKTKTAHILFGIYGGDGGSIKSVYFGRFTPSLVLYTDGQLIIKEGDFQKGFTLYETKLQLSEICSLLSEIEATGFFSTIPENVNSYSNEESPIYQFDETTEFSDGAANLVIQVNGDPARIVSVYIPYRDYLIPEVSTTLQILENYRPADLKPYKPEKLMVWIQKWNHDLPEGIQIQTWSEILPSIEALWESYYTPRDTLDPFDEGGHIVFSGEDVDSFLQVFGSRIEDGFYSTQDQTFLVVIRPLFPHESTQIFPWISIPSKAVSFEPAIHCNHSEPE